MLVVQLGLRGAQSQDVDVKSLLQRIKNWKPK